jgi:hypothetical protein
LSARYLASTGITVTGGNVSAVADQSGSGNNITTVTGAMKQVTVAGSSWIRSSDGASSLTLPASLGFNARANSVFIIFRFGGGVLYSPGAGNIADLFPENNSVVAVNTNVTNTSTIYHSHAPAMIGMTGDTGACIAYLDGENQSLAANVNSSTTGGFIGQYGGGGFFVPANSDWAEILVYDHVLSGADLTALRAYAAATYKVGSATPSQMWVMDGDSIPAGLGLTAPVTDNYYSIQLSRFGAQAIKFWNIAVAGRPLSTCLTNYAANVAPYYSQNAAFGANRIVNIDAGINDVSNGDSAAVIQTHDTSYVTAAHGTGYKVLSQTMIKALTLTAGQETIRQTVNAFRVAKSNGADYVSTVASDFRFVDPLDTDWYQIDGVHPTFNGAAVKAQYVYLAVNGTPAVTYACAGNSSGAVGVQQTFTLTVNSNGPFLKETITPSDNGGGGTFDHASYTTAIGDTTVTVKYTPASAGVKSLTFTNNGILGDPTAFSFTSSAPTSSGMNVAMMDLATGGALLGMF